MSKKITSAFSQKVEELSAKRRVKIAFGLLRPDKEIQDSLKPASQYADITLVGPKEISGINEFPVVVDENPEHKLASMLANDEVEGIVRGTIDDFKTFEAYRSLTGEQSALNPGLLEDPFGRQFFLSPASNPEGWEKEERLRMAQGIAEFIKEWGIEPKIAVFTGERHETYPRKKHIQEGVVGILNKTYEDAEWIVSRSKEKGYESKNWAIDLNPAVEAGYNILIPVNGMVGNQIFRVVLFCGGKILAGPRLGLSRCYEDNSRTEKDFEYHVKWLAAWINSRENKH